MREYIDLKTGDVYYEFGQTNTSRKGEKFTTHDSAESRRMAESGDWIIVSIVHDEHTLERIVP